MAESDSDSKNNFTFHRNHGALVQLSENRLTAFRQRPSHEFNQGLVFSNKPLKNDEIFEVRIDRKVRTLCQKNKSCIFLSYVLHMNCDLRYTRGPGVYKLVW